MLFRRWRRRSSQEVEVLLGAGRVVIVDDRANSFGVESGGKGQIRGNGCLGASEDALAFAMWLPRRQFVIGRDRITGVERTKSHLGKSIGRELLRVRFTNDAGQPDSAAWYVRDIEAWERALVT